MGLVRVTATPHASGWTCQVSVEEAGRSLSDHIVEVTKLDIEHIGLGSTVEDLVKRSFELLLEREPPLSILKRFTLADIERYFPDYPGVIGA